MNPFPLPLIIRQATLQNLPCLLIGGHAVNHYSAPRLTLDVDLMIRKSDGKAWSDLVIAEGFRLLHDGGNFLQFSPPYGTNWRLDFMLVGEATFEKLHGQSTRVTAMGAELNLPSPAHLIALKLHALAHGPVARRDKDLPDIVNIINEQKLQLDENPLAEIFERYGTPELICEVSQRLKTP